MSERNDDRVDVVENKRQRFLNQAQPFQRTVKNPIVTENHLPEKHTQKVAGPKRNGDKKQPKSLVIAAVEGNEVSHRVCKQNRCQHHDRRNTQ